MAITTRDLYASSNGDRWQLVQDDAGCVYVVQQANLASGGRRSEIPWPRSSARATVRSTRSYCG